MQQQISILTDFVPRLRECRRHMGLTQAQFAQVAGVGLGAQNRYEAGATEPSASYFAHLATAGVDVVWLLTGRRSSDSLDEDTSALVSAAHGLAQPQRKALLGFLGTLAGTPQQVTAPSSLPSETALADALGAFLEATPGLAGAELAQELATQLPIILQAASGEAGFPRSARHEPLTVPPAADDADRRVPRRGRRT